MAPEVYRSPAVVLTVFERWPLSRARVAAVVWAGADHRRQLGLDQRLVDRLRRQPNPVLDISPLDHLQHLEQSRLVQSRRVCWSFREFHWRGSR
jgi:hypothetical protein